MFSEFISIIFVSIIKVFVFVYTYVTLPLYYIYQKPWIRLRLANTVKSVRNNPSDPSSPWVRPGTAPRHEVMEVNTIDEMFDMIHKKFGPKHTFCGTKLGSGVKVQYKWYSISDITKRVNNIAKGLQLLGIGKDDMVLIFAETRLEWMLCAFAIYKIGGKIVTLFAQLGHEGIIHGINQTEVKYAITTAQQLTKLKEVNASTPSIVSIVDIDGASENFNNVQVKGLNEIENNGANSSVWLSPQSINTKDDIAVIMYTSGTTGTPKGVIATHGQLIAHTKGLLTIVNDIVDDYDKHIYIGYLPLGHMFEFCAELFFMAFGVKIGYANAMTLIEGSPGLAPGEKPDIYYIRPTIMVAVPLVLDRIRRGVYETLKTRPKLAQLLFNDLINYKDFWRSKGYHTPMTNFFLCRKAREKLGGDLTYFLVGGAPLSPETQKIVSLAFDVLVMEAFGGTEVCGASHVTSIHGLSFGNTGGPVHGVKVKLVDWIDGGYCLTDKPNPRGEIVTCGGLITSGYYKLEKETNEAYRYENGERWYYSGDIGEALPDGNFKIIDRRKDLIKLQNGEYFSLGKIEAALKSCRYIENICVHGSDTHDYLVALVVPNKAIIEKFAKDYNLNNNNFKYHCIHPKIVATVSNGIVAYGKSNGLNKREIPVKYALCSDVWTPDNGMLTAALKLRRQIILKQYKQEVSQMFSETNNNVK